MQALPLVSVISPSFNQVRFLEATIRPVLEQDYPCLEYIIIDGGSPDGGREIIEKYAERLAWRGIEQDRGQTDAINKVANYYLRKVTAGCWKWRRRRMMARTENGEQNAEKRLLRINIDGGKG